MLHYVEIVQVKDQKDIWPTILIDMKGLLIEDALVDSDARISLISNVVVTNIWISICKMSSTKVIVANRGLVPCFGVIEDVVIECFGISISWMYFHVIPRKGPSHSLLLGRPWMQELNVCRIRVMVSWHYHHKRGSTSSIICIYNKQLKVQRRKNHLPKIASKKGKVYQVMILHQIGSFQSYL